MNPYDIITFDCYGTLIDWRGGIAAAFEMAARSCGRSVSVEHVLKLHAKLEPVVQQAGYKRYGDVLRDVAAGIMNRLGWPDADRPEASFLPDSLATWPAFSDTNGALLRLREAGYRLGILSNIDNDLFAASSGANLDVEFDLVVTAEDVGAYKPARPHFDRALHEMGDARWLHAAQSYVHDVEPAVALGIPVAWVNRLGETRGGTAHPDREVPDLAALAGWLAAR